ncbi:MAG: metal-dependent hydrolase family protein [Vulcanimicrobiaceae bacterium]
MIVRAGVFYDGTLETPGRNVDLRIESGRIAQILAAQEGAGADLQANCVTPGLVNAHVHLEMSAQPDTLTALTSSSQNQRLLHAVENARKSLQAGVTTVRDLGSSNAIAMVLRDAVNAGRISGPRIRAAGAVLCMTGGHGWFMGRQVDGPWDARKAVREQLRDGADCIKLIATGGVLTPGTVPGNAQLTEEELRAACEEARRHGLRIASHAIGAEGIKNALRAGVTSIEHGHMLDEQALALFKAQEAYLVPTLTAPTCILEHLADGTQPAYVLEKAKVVGDAMLVNIRRAFEAGVKIAGGSDAGTPYNQHENYAYEIELMHRLLGMTPQQALHAATAVAAELIGLHRGVLAVGEPADLLLLDRDIADDMRTLARPQGVLKDGRLVALAA